MSEPFKCEVCGGEGRRRRGTFVPEGWFYGEVRNEGEVGTDGEIVVTGVCSVACRDGFWKQGPGKLPLGRPDWLAASRLKEDELILRRPDEDGRVPTQCKPAGFGTVAMVHDAIIGTPGDPAFEAAVAQSKDVAHRWGALSTHGRFCRVCGIHRWEHPGKEVRYRRPPPGMQWLGGCPPCIPDLSMVKIPTDLAVGERWPEPVDPAAAALKKVDEIFERMNRRTSEILRPLVEVVAALEKRAEHLKESEALFRRMLWLMHMNGERGRGHEPAPDGSMRCLTCDLDFASADVEVIEERLVGQKILNLLQGLTPAGG